MILKKNPLLSSSVAKGKQRKSLLPFACGWPELTSSIKVVIKNIFLFCLHSKRGLSFSSQSQLLS